MGAAAGAFAVVKNEHDDSHAIVSLTHDDSNTAQYMALFVARKLEEIGLRTNPDLSLQNEVKASQVIMILVTSEFVNAASSNESAVKSLLEEVRKHSVVLPLVIDAGVRNPVAWGPLRPLADIFYIDLVPATETGFPLMEKVREVQEKALQMSGVSISKYYITMHGDPNWRSRVQKDSPYLEEGFTNTSGACGGGGIFEAYDVAIPGMKKVDLGHVEFWVSTTRTHTNMLEWRLFTVPDKSKYLITSKRSDTAPGWSLKELFYAPGTPTIGCDQKSKPDGKWYHIMNSHNWSNGNHLRVMQAHQYMASRGVISWVDEEQLRDTENIVDQLHEAIDKTVVVIVYITADYIAKVNSGVELDNCYREYKHYKQRFEEGNVKLVFGVTAEDVSDVSQWGLLSELTTGCPIVSMTENYTPLYECICNVINLHPGIFYITMVQWKSYVQQGGFYTENGFTTDSNSCGAGGIFEAYTQPAPGLVRIDVENATFYACAQKVSLQQLEWRCYKYTDKSTTKYLVTSNRYDMAPGWTFVHSFYCRGVPSRGCDQKATLDV